MPELSYSAGSNCCEQHLRFMLADAGDKQFACNVARLQIDVTRIVNVRDVVPSVPGMTTMALKQVVLTPSPQHRLHFIHFLVCVNGNECA